MFLGDVMGSPGRKAVKALLPRLKERHQVDITLLNVENSAGGFGVTPDVLRELEACGVNGFTSGNHIWDKKEIIDLMDGLPNLVRPLNYPPGNPGRGTMILETAGGMKLGVINLMGRAFMPPLDCPFRAAAQAVQEMTQRTPCILVDFHGEGTSEKNAMGWYLNGKVSAVIGTHTHVQTADERVLSGGTAYITDAGLTGSIDSIIGMEIEGAMERFLSGRPVRYEPAGANLRVQGVVVSMDDKTGTALSILRISEPMKE